MVFRCPVSKSKNIPTGSIGAQWSPFLVHFAAPGESSRRHTNGREFKFGHNVFPSTLHIVFQAQCDRWNKIFNLKIYCVVGKRRCSINGT